jgi:hypothetical protein
MSEDFETQFHQMSNDELIDFALKKLGDENETLRHQALLAHFHRVKDAPATIRAKPGNTDVLETILNQFH